MTGLLYVVTLAAVLGCGLMAGVFFAFSSFVMNGLGRLPADEGIAAMQSVNETAITPPFMLALMGTAAGCAGLGVYAVLNWGEPPAAWLLGGSVLYLAGAIGLTMGRNVPLNDALAAISPQAADAARVWNGYLADWTAWNHVRAAASLGATALFAVALALG